jgi:glycine cleavage system H protein
VGYPNDRRYTNEHEWAKQDGNTVSIGITQYAQDSLGDVVYVELPKPGMKLTKGQAFGVVESTKAVSELFAPVSGTVVAVNDPLADAPETVNADPYEKAWMVKVEVANAAEFEALMTSAQYEEFLKASGH